MSSASSTILAAAALLIALLLLVVSASSAQAIGARPSFEGAAPQNLPQAPPTNPHPVAPTWVAHSTKVSPPAVAWPSMTYDAADGYVVLFGGCLGTSGGCAPLSDQTWVYQGGVWANLSELQPHPSARYAAGMTFDSADGYVLLYGGQGYANTPLNDTWKFSAGHWTNISSTAGTAPGGRRGATLFNDTADGYTVMCCGWDGNGNLGDTWKFSGGVWSSLATSVPVRNGAPGTWDGFSGHGLLFGGGDFGALGDTQAYAAGSWTTLSGGPPAGQGAGLAYDPSYGYDLLFGGVNGVPSSQTWSLSGGTWTQQTPSTSPTARCCGGEVFDAHDGYVLLFGGGDGNGPPYYNDTWIWTGTNGLMLNSFYANPNPMDLGGTTTFSVSASGGAPAYTYAYTGLPPGCASANAPSLACTPTSVGNFLVRVWVNDTAGNSVQGILDLGVSTGPAVTSFTATPAAVDVTVPTTLYAAVAGGAVPISFVYTGLPRSCSSTNAPSIVCTPSLPGTYPVTVNATDSFGKYATATLTLIVSPLPRVTSFLASTNPQDQGLTVTLSTSVLGGTGTFQYSYLGLPAGCSSSNTATLSCTSVVTGTFPVEVNATDAVARSAFGFLNLTVAPDPTMVSFVVAPSSVDVGGTVVLSLTVTGGVSPFAYAVSGLPHGCTSQNLSTFSCAPTLAGTYLLQGSATDIRAETATATATLVVHPALQITSFGVVHLPLDQGQALGLRVTAAGGAPPYTISYAGLPAGCASGNTSSLTCIPSLAGTYGVTVTVSDRAGGSVSSLLNFTVAPALQLESFAANPSTIALGGSTTLGVLTLGGTAPLTITFIGLPPGCLPQNASQLPCTPTAAGTYTVGLVVIDMAGETLKANATLVVAPPVPFIDQTIFSVPLWGWLALIVLLILVGLAVLLVRRRKGQGGLAAQPFGQASQGYVNPVPPPSMSEGAWAPGPDPMEVQAGAPPVPPLPPGA